MRSRSLALVMILGVSSVLRADDIHVFRSGQIHSGSYDSRTETGPQVQVDKFLQNSYLDESWAHARIDMASSAIAWGTHACSGPPTAGDTGQAYGYASSTVETPYQIISNSLATGTLVNVQFAYRYSLRYGADRDGPSSLGVENGLLFNIGTPTDNNAVREQGKVTFNAPSGTQGFVKSGLFTSFDASRTATFQARVGQTISLSILGYARCESQASFPGYSTGNSEAAFTWGLSGAGISFASSYGPPPTVPGDPKDWIPNSPVPEPGTLVALGLGAVAFIRKRR